MICEPLSRNPTILQFFMIYVEGTINLYSVSAEKIEGTCLIDYNSQRKPAMKIELDSQWGNL